MTRHTGCPVLLAQCMELVLRLRPYRRVTIEWNLAFNFHNETCWKDEEGHFSMRLPSKRPTIPLHCGVQYRQVQEPTFLYQRTFAAPALHRGVRCPLSIRIKKIKCQKPARIQSSLNYLGASLELWLML